MHHNALFASVGPSLVASSKVYILEIFLRASSLPVRFRAKAKEAKQWAARSMKEAETRCISSISPQEMKVRTVVTAYSPMDTFDVCFQVI